jgi:hypothetical protein
MDTLHPRCAGRNVHKDTVVACIACIRGLDNRQRIDVVDASAERELHPACGLLDAFVGEHRAERNTVVLQEVPKGATWTAIRCVGIKAFLDYHGRRSRRALAITSIGKEGLRHKRKSNQAPGKYSGSQTGGAPAVDSEQPFHPCYPCDSAFRMEPARTPAFERLATAAKAGRSIGIVKAGSRRYGTKTASMK